MKEIGYKIFALIYRICTVLSIKDNTAFLIMTHDDGPEGNARVLAKYMQNQYQTKFWTLRRNDTSFHSFKKVIMFFLVKPMQMAKAQYIFMDNAFLPMADFQVRKGTTVLQLWHGTGTIKKFGQDANTGKLYKLEQKANKNIDYVIVNSESTKKLYAGCFGVPEEKVKVLGCPRTDLLFSKRQQEKRKEKFYQQYPELRQKKIVLYAPTFRDQEVESPRVHLDLEKAINTLPDDTVLGLRLHPFVADAFVMGSQYKGRIVNFSNYDSINTLLMVTDILISDYSSIVFEYCVYQRPIIFYAYDLEEFSDSGRGFYEDYETYVPGAVVKNEDELFTALNRTDKYAEKRKKFFEEAYAYKDGKSCKRIAETIFDSHLVNYQTSQK